MATSGSTDFTLTRDEIITEALENIGVLASGESLESADITSAARTFNIVLKSLQADPSIDFSFIEQQTVALSDGTASYSLESDTIGIMDFWLRISNTDYHLNIINRETYDLKPDKTAEGQPQDVYVDFATATPTAYFYPTPNASYTAYFVQQRAVEDVDTSTDNVDVHVVALDMIVKGVTAAVASKFRVDIQERLYFDGKFAEAKREYRAGNTNRNGREIIRPNFVV